MLKLNYAAASDRGLVRGNNEDSAYAGPHLLALADGMGGHAAGEIASQLMINQLRHLDTHPEENDMLNMLADAADNGNRAIAKGVREAPETDGMGTTLTAIMFDGSSLGLCHVGDSRGYLLRDGELEQITVDDTFVQSLVNEGKLAAEDVSTHPQRSLILKAYNGRPVQPTLRLIDAQAHDRLLLCSDGLSDPVTASTIAKTLEEGTPEEAARRLVELALRSGGPDNVTVVVADVLESEDPHSEFPTKPVAAGALLGNAPEDPRPDTAAGRAAMMASRQPKTIPAAGSSESDDTGDDDEEEESPKPQSKKRSKKKFFWIFLIFILIAGVAAGGWWGNTRLHNIYFVAVSNEEILIDQGVNYTFVGKSLHSHYQDVCIDRNGKLTLSDAGNGASNSQCSIFTIKALPESVRPSVTTLPNGSYNEVLQQLQRLADQALPVCIIREPEDPNKPNEPSSTHSSGDLNSPGVNCREVK